MAAQDLCTTTDVAEELRLSASQLAATITTGVTLSQHIAAKITLASDTIMGEYEREFATTVTNPATRRFDWNLNGLLVDLTPYDLQANLTLSNVTVVFHPESASPVTLTPLTDYQLTPINAPGSAYTTLRISQFFYTLFSQTALRFGYILIDVTGNWGFPTIPNDVKQAAIETVCSWVRRDLSQAQLADTSVYEAAPDAFGSYSIPPSARRKLARWRRNPGLVAT